MGPRSSMRKGRRPVTTADVARKAGVSRTLVSFVLNGRSDVGSATRERILAVIAELGYKPNRQARLLVRQKVGVVGLLLDIRTDTDLLVLHFVSALGERLAESAYGLLLARPDRQDPLAPIIRAVDEQLVDGLVLMDVQRQDPRADWLQAAEFPYVLYPGNDPSRPFDVHADYEGGAKQVVEHLYRGGHRRVALLTGPDPYVYVYRREQGFRRAAAECGLVVDDRFVFRGAVSEAFGWEVGRSLGAMPDRPSALFATADNLAVGAVRGLLECGIHVPGEVAVIGFGDSPMAQGLRPTLTTVSIPVFELGRAAADQILAQIEGKGINAGPYIAPATLVVRESG